MTAVAPAAALAVEMRHIEKRFGAVHANRGVNLAVRAGTVHGIVGENGAGKSTLMSILYGFYQADSGEIAISRDAAGSLVTARALELYVGMPPKQLNHNGGIWGLSVNICHGIYRMLGVTPGSAKVKRWQNGLESRVNKAIAKATS